LIVPLEDIDNDGNFEDHERLAMVYELFNEKQKNRYAKFKESSLENRNKKRSANKIEFPRIKQIVQNILGENVQLSNPVQIALHGIAKIYCGELVEEAKEIMVEEEGLRPKYGPIKPKHLREARRRMTLRGVLPSNKPKRILIKK
jgi:hypothetical protein